MNQSQTGSDSGPIVQGPYIFTVCPSFLQGLRMFKLWGGGKGESTQH